MKSDNQNITFININVMKTNIYSKIAKIAVVLIFFVASAPSLLAQFAATTQVDQTPIEERKGSVSTYTVPGPGTDEYSWEVVGGAVTNPAIRCYRVRYHSRSLCCSLYSRTDSN